MAHGMKCTKVDKYTIHTQKYTKHTWHTNGSTEYLGIFKTIKFAQHMCLNMGKELMLQLKTTYICNSTAKFNSPDILVFTVWCFNSDCQNVATFLQKYMFEYVLLILIK